MRATLGMNVLILQPLGSRGFISESNVPSFWPTRPFHVQCLLNAPNCLSCVAEFFCTTFSFNLSLGSFFCSLQLDCRGAHPLPGFFSQLRGVCLCTFPFPLFKMADTNIWVSAYVPHTSRPNEVVQMYWKEERQPGMWGAGVSPPCLVALPARGHLALLTRRLPLSAGPLPRTMTMVGILPPMRSASIWAPTPAAEASLLPGYPAAAVIHRHHLQTRGYRRPHQ